MAALNRSWLLVLVLWCAVLASAATVVWTRHRARELFVELEQLNRERHQLEVVWGQWQIEQRTKSQHAHIEVEARRRLQMSMPDPAAIQVVLP